MRSELARAVRARCMLSRSADFFEPFEEWRGRPLPLSSVVEAFRSNLRAARLVGALPFQLVQSGVLQRRFDRLRLADLIESGAEPDSEHYSEQQEQASRRADAAMTQLTASKKFIDEVADEVLHVLDQSLKSVDFSEASHELLRQVLVMSWGALEVLSSDLGVAVVNTRPALAKGIMELDKRAAIIRGLPFETLEAFNFDVSRSMGDIIFSGRRLETLPLIRDFCKATFSNAALQEALNSSTLWLLAQRRHLIVHRRGIVDSQYLQNTSDNQPLGTRIEISATEVANSLIEVRNVGLRMADCALRLFDPQSDE